MRYLICWIVVAMVCWSCATRRVETVRIDTVRVEGGEQAAIGHEMVDNRHDTVTVTIERFDTVQRLSERVTVRRGRHSTVVVHDTVVVRDTVRVVEGSSERYSTATEVNREGGTPWWMTCTTLLLVIACIIALVSKRTTRS